MSKRSLALFAAVSMVLAGSTSAFAGASASAPTKNSGHVTHLASDQHRGHKSSQTAAVEITQFTSSSAHKH